MCGGRPTTSFALVGYPHRRKNGGHSGGFHAAAYGARQKLRRAESQ